MSRSRWIVAAVVLSCAAVAGLLLAPRRGPAVAPPPAPGGVDGDAAPRGPTGGTEPARPVTGPPWEALARGEDPTAAARDLFERAVEDRALLLRLIAAMGDASLGEPLRSRLALVVGATRDPEALAAIRAAILAGGPPDWIATLVDALGLSAEDPFPDAESEGTPYVWRHPSGLLLLTDGVIGDPETVAVVASRLEDGATEVRRASERSLVVTLYSLEEDRRATPTPDSEAVRLAFVARLRAEPVEGLRAAIAHSLSEWAARVAPDTAGRDETLALVLDAALDPEAETVRLRAAAGLGAGPLAAAERKRLLAAATSDDLDLRTFAVGVLTTQLPRLTATEKEEFRHTLVAGLAHANPKIREASAAALAGFPGSAPPLVAALSDPEWNVRLGAVRALGVLKETGAREPLERLAASDVNEFVRKAAAEALAALPR